MPNFELSRALEEIADLIEGQRIAKSSPYKIVWNKDHFEIQSIHKLDTQSFLIIKFYALDINKYLTSQKWDIITARVRTLTETGVIK